MIKLKAVKGLELSNSTQTNKCEDCAYGKICRAHHATRSRIVASSSAAVIHFDTVGPIDVPSLGNSKYFVLATEEFSNYKLIEFVQSKEEITNIVKRIITQVELESNRPVKQILSDNGSEYVNHNLSSWLQDKGILHEKSATYTPEQNGTAERANRTIIEGTRVLVQRIKAKLGATLAEQLWAEAAQTTVYTTNLLLSPRDQTKSRYELYTGRVPSVEHLKIFGQEAIIRRNDHEQTSKFSSKGQKVLFIRYTKRVNTFRFLSLHDNKIIISCDAVFLSNDPPKTDKPIESRSCSINIFDNEDCSNDEA